MAVLAVSRLFPHMTPLFHPRTISIDTSLSFFFPLRRINAAMRPFTSCQSISISTMVSCFLRRAYTYFSSLTPFFFDSNRPGPV